MAHQPRIFLLSCLEARLGRTRPALLDDGAHVEAHASSALAGLKQRPSAYPTAAVSADAAGWTRLNAICYFAGSHNAPGSSRGPPGATAQWRPSKRGSREHPRDTLAEGGLHDAR